MVGGSFVVWLVFVQPAPSTCMTDRTSFITGYFLLLKPWLLGFKYTYIHATPECVCVHARVREGEKEGVGPNAREHGSSVPTRQRGRVAAFSLHRVGGGLSCSYCSFPSVRVISTVIHPCAHTAASLCVRSEDSDSGGQSYMVITLPTVPTP